MLDNTITNALLALRAQIIRGGLDGLPHVEALLIARGIDPAKQRVPRKQPDDSFKRMGLRWCIMDGLRGGPVRSTVLIERVMAKQPDLSREDAVHRVHNALWKMKVAGMAVRGEKDHMRRYVWRLAQ